MSDTPERIRHVDGAKLNWAFVWNVEPAGDGKGKGTSGDNREAESRDAPGARPHKAWKRMACSRGEFIAGRHPTTGSKLEKN